MTMLDVGKWYFGENSFGIKYEYLGRLVETNVEAVVNKLLFRPEGEDFVFAMTRSEAKIMTPVTGG